VREAARAASRRFVNDPASEPLAHSLLAAGRRLPAVFSHDFDGEPRRWANLVRLYAPVHYLPDNAAPSDIRATLLRAAGRG